MPIIALLHEMEAVSDGALEAMLMDVLSGQDTAVEAVHQVIDAPPARLVEVGERLRTGALAERFFIDHCRDLVGFSQNDLLDTRLDACGYDFATRLKPSPLRSKGTRLKPRRTAVHRPRMANRPTL